MFLVNDRIQAVNVKKPIDTEFGQRRCGFKKLSIVKLFLDGSLITSVSYPYTGFYWKNYTAGKKFDIFLIKDCNLLIFRPL